MEFMLEGKTVLIAGGSSGIGLAVAGLAYKNGACVIIASRNAVKKKDRLEDLVGETIETRSFDVTSTESVCGLFRAADSLDHLVIAVRPDITASLFLATEISEATQAFDTKFWGTYRLIQAAHPYMKENGSITVTSGIAGEKIYKRASTMASINSAVETLCRSLAVELAPLRVNAVSPGFVEPKPPEIQDYAGQFPSRRLASVNDVATAYLYLMTNPYATGETTVVDGGARLV
jgi:NAD(P)-dependent dehydrogenase (short-subunit alcohol dehydrogenase family)